MSSHHVVREKQEPALLVLGLGNFPDELLGQLLEWSPTVIATPQTAEALNAYGIKIDWIIGDDDNHVLQSDVRFMPTGDKDSLTETALQYLTDNNYPSVNIVINDLNLKEYEHFADKINLVVFNNNKKIYAVHPGFSKWKPACETIELLSPASSLRCTGLEKTGSGNYKTEADGFFTLDFKEAYIFIAEEV
jgi:thiamine pyrophosphokinase